MYGELLPQKEQTGENWPKADQDTQTQMKGGIHVKPLQGESFILNSNWDKGLPPVVPC